VSVKWRKSQERWSSIGFRASDKTTWAVSQKRYEDVVVDCPELEFTEKEKSQLIKEIAPLLVGAKQAQKKEKQDEVIRAVAYFLRYVRCCQREIPVSALPHILVDFDIKIKSHDKQTHFLRLLTKWDWIYIRVEYCHPEKHRTKAGSNRARAYGVGKAFAERLQAVVEETETVITNNTQEYKSDLYTVSYFFRRPERLNIPSFDDQINNQFLTTNRH